ncbi:cyclic nucleotide-gated ion channel 1-like [Quercus lobata]|uniref:Cyclic nucleotide-binding domain-containing protein n=1 Tax=Quercus lobata TaxID=97700 RepID=A0A7N2LL24_QUELO|nr:cyclic nucleotide-gated ion channel 1-like [Quercus lobata]XP_030965630.1 cyclic nucleotide-gated ion channel 1-like [Quercus lobata]XP_030965631.1 cyclic nucleotide-gated ion channel 1-like [Quercus lobata]XP_030965632.1 cyclic nucleotide-gated ion channel 1-like [Quercus lobata]XP_030965633.1 cyclic nucleotide-gated ion channel 1-like [Quercus lobata]
MDFKRLKFVRFEDWSSERSESSEWRYSIDDGPQLRKPRSTFGNVLKISGIPSVGDQPSKESGPPLRKTILDPQGQFLQTWNKIFVLSCVIAVALDPLFFYIPVIDDKDKCLDLDETLTIIACVLRSLFDAFYALHIIFQFRTGFIAPSSRVFGRGETITDPVAIAKRYLSTYFFIDILSILPLPQVVTFLIIPSMKTEVPLVMKEMLKSVIFSQYVPRLLRIYPLYVEVTRTSGILTQTAWAGAAYNLSLYMLASHVVGAFWYLFAIEREDTCWHKHCDNTIGCEDKDFYCGKDRSKSYVDPYKNCPFIDPDDIKNKTVFNFGIFTDALKSGVVESRNFREKFFYCFWWGLRGLSSLGQNLKTSTYVGEIIFAVFISIFGLVLFSLLIGNMQKYLQSTTVRVEEMRVKRTDAEQWMSHRMLPENLRERIRRYEQYKWQETRGVEEENLVRNLPKDLRRDIKRHLCLDLLKRVPMFEKMDEQLLDALCDHLKPVLYTAKSCIVREGDPVDEMLFIMRGTLATMTTNGGRTGFFNSADLKAGDFCGEELLTWALDPHPSTNLPISTRTVVAIIEVEAFALMAYDLKFVASQFRRLHSKQLQHTFRFYSLQWRTWGACFIQVAWRRYCKRKLDKSLREAEDRLQDALANEAGNSPSLGATIYASRFAANALRTLRQNGARKTRVPQRLLPLLPQKPPEPNFDAENH